MADAYFVFFSRTIKSSKQTTKNLETTQIIGEKSIEQRNTEIKFMK